MKLVGLGQCMGRVYVVGSIWCLEFDMNQVEKLFGGVLDDVVVESVGVCFVYCVKF